MKDFEWPGYDRPLSSLADMEKLLFTVEANETGWPDVIYLDNITASVE